MKRQAKATIRLTEDGCLRLPEYLIEEFGLKAGAEVVLEKGHNEVRLLRPVSHLARVYLEPTNSCSLHCRTCIRNVWDEEPGFMEDAVFERLLGGLKAFSPPPSIFLGGFGEPLYHRQILAMVRQIKARGMKAELITNGMLLTGETAAGLVEAGLDVLWVSMDGVRPESYADIRLGANLSQVVGSLEGLVKIRQARGRLKPELGLAFVAMQRNIQDLPELLAMGRRLGAAYFSISNVIPHTTELSREILYQEALYQGGYQVSAGLGQVSLPRLDFQGSTLEMIGEALGGRYRFNLAGCELSGTINRCPFIYRGSLSVRWDGQVSPCLPLLHSHPSYLDDRLRQTEAYFIGSLLERDLADLWNDRGYVALRERLRDFDFSPCTFCNSCEMAGNTYEDCFGNEAPTCGGCLWAQGIIQCP